MPCDLYLATYRLGMLRKLIRLGRATVLSLPHHYGSTPDEPGQLEIFRSSGTQQMVRYRGIKKLVKDGSEESA